jgi:hypothetical protein
LEFSHRLDRSRTSRDFRDRGCGFRRSLERPAGARPRVGCQTGRLYVAEALCARIYGELPPPPFRYRHWGNLATIGRKSAVVDLGRLTLSGVVAWWFWGAVHLFLVVGLRNRASVFLGWIWSYATYQVGVQLITGLPVVEAARRPANSLPTQDLEAHAIKGAAP